MHNLNNKVVVVTGGGGLLGGSILAHLKDKGAIGINAELNITDDLESGNLKCNITDRESVSEVVNRIIKKYGRIDGWVNNAYPRTDDWGNKFEDIKAASWQKNVDWQMNSVFTCCQLVLKQMQKQRSGSIVNIASIYGVVGPDFTVYDGTQMTMPAAYAAIKGGIVNFTRYLASYYGKYNIRINCISPGGIFDNQPAAFVSQYERKVPMQRMGLPVDVAGPVAFLLSEESAYITGHNLMVDGGWTAI